MSGIGAECARRRRGSANAPQPDLRRSFDVQHTHHNWCVAPGLIQRWGRVSRPALYGFHRLKEWCTLNRMLGFAAESERRRRA